MKRSAHVLLGKGSGKNLEMFLLRTKKVTLSLVNSNMVKPKKIDHLHSVYPFTVPLKEFYFKFWRNKFTAFFCQKIWKITIFHYLIANTQLKCSIIYKKIVMWAVDDEQRINYEWPNHTLRSLFGNQQQKKLLISLHVSLCSKLC